MNWEIRKVNTIKGEQGFVKKEVTLSKKIATYYTPSEHKEITDYCKENGLNMNQFIRSAIAKYLELNRK
jgi:hypothetical protein